MIEIRHLYKAFDNHMVLRNLNMKINEGAVYGFVGPNGAGKTTTMRIIAGLLKADSGQILIDGEDIGVRHKELIGYMPDFFGVYDRLRVKEYMAFFASIYGLDKEETEKKIRQLLELVRLTEKKEAYVDSLSRGMKQRLGIAQALLNRPKLLICDEPTSALDPVGRKEILDILLAIREQTTVLFSTHILSDVERICTDVAFLNSGVVGVQGKLSDIKTRYRSEEYQLETGNDTDMLILQQTFPNMQQIGRNQLVFCEGDYTAFDILRFIADRHIALLKLERAEPTLESLFMEVVEK